MARETEFKYLLRAADYDALRSALGAPLKERTLVNRYFALQEPTERKDWVLRLRLENDARELTLKIGREIGPGLFDSQEFNATVFTEDPTDWEQTTPLQMFRSEISTDAVSVQGESRTVRSVFVAPIEVGRYWELDRCELPDGSVFCELEVEVSADDLELKKAALNEWLLAQGVAPQVSNKTKYRRFLDSVSKRT